MQMKKLYPLVFIFTLSINALFSQSPAQLPVFENWTTNAGTQSWSHPMVTKTDPYNNVYTAGGTIQLSGSGLTDILITKDSPKGKRLWTRTYNGTRTL